MIFTKINYLGEHQEGLCEQGGGLIDTHPIDKYQEVVYIYQPFANWAQLRLSKVEKYVDYAPHSCNAMVT